MLPVWLPISSCCPVPPVHPTYPKCGTSPSQIQIYLNKFQCQEPETEEGTGWGHRSEMQGSKQGGPCSATALWTLGSEDL